MIDELDSLPLDKREERRKAAYQKGRWDEVDGATVDEEFATLIRSSRSSHEQVERKIFNPASYIVVSDHVRVYFYLAL